MNPYHHYRALMSHVALDGLLSVLVACLDVKKSKTCTSVQTGSFVSWCRTCTCLFLSSFVLCFVCDLLCCGICVVILGKSHYYLLYYLVPAVQPRMLVTLDEDLKSVSVTVRVGQVGYGIDC